MKELFTENKFKMLVATMEAHKASRSKTCLWGWLPCQILEQLFLKRLIGLILFILTLIK